MSVSLFSVYNTDQYHSQALDEAGDCRGLGGLTFSSFKVFLELSSATAAAAETEAAMLAKI